MDDWTPAYFNPPLAAERNGWVLNRLRQHSIQTVLDIGCGEGSLLRSLCEPSTERYDPRIPLDPDITARPLYPILLGGLDVDEYSIQTAAERTAPREFDPDAPRYSSAGLPRWNEVRVQLWCGGIETLNGEFVDRYQCFVSTEVVEHVPENILDVFLPLVLGYYRPEFLLLTTPNYLYNVLFSPPGVENETAYPDPTGKTTRVFRHHDHKREWTPNEWHEWCELGAAANGYDVELGSIGYLGRPDAFGREVEGGGTLTAVFRRCTDRKRVLPPSFLPKTEYMQNPIVLADAIDSSSSTIVNNSLSQPLSVETHKLIAHHLHLTHPSAGIALPSADILRRVRDVFRYSPGNELPFELVWLANEVDIACGGLLRTLLDALLLSPQSSMDDSLMVQEAHIAGELEWEITQGSPNDLLTWIVLWRKWVPPPVLKDDSSHVVWDGTIEEDEYQWPRDQDASFDAGAEEPATWDAHVSESDKEWDRVANETIRGWREDSDIQLFPPAGGEFARDLLECGDSAMNIAVHADPGTIANNSTDGLPKQHLMDGVENPHIWSDTSRE